MFKVLTQKVAKMLKLMCTMYGKLNQTGVVVVVVVVVIIIIIIIIIIIEDFIFVFMNYLHNLRTRVWASYVTINHFLCIETVYTYS